MRLESFRVFGCFGFRDSGEIELDTPSNLVYFLGRNSSGKTSVLRALCYFEYREVPSEHPNFANYEAYESEPLLRAKFSYDTSTGWKLSTELLATGVLQVANGPQLTLRKDENGFSAEPQTVSAQRAVTLMDQVYDEYSGLIEAIEDAGQVWIEKLGDGSYRFLPKADDYTDFEHRQGVITTLVGQLRNAFQQDGWRYPQQLDFNYIEGLLFKQFPEIYFFTRRFSLNEDLPRSIRSQNLDSEQNSVTESFMDLLDKTTLRALLNATGRGRIEELKDRLQAKLDALCARINEGASADATDGFLRIFVDRQDDVRVILEVDGKESYYEHLSDNTKFLVAYHIFQEERERKGSLPSILLFDEPNEGFHPSAEGKLLRFLESLAAKGNQVLVSTHSQYMIDLDHLSTVRIMVRDEDDALRVENRLYGSSGASRDTLALQPVTDAIGLQYADQLVVRDKVVVTEGYTELLYLRYFSRLLGYEEPNLAPVTGDGKIHTFIPFLISQGIFFKVILDQRKIRTAIRKAIPVPNDLFFILSEHLGMKASDPIGVEDLISRNDFKMLLDRCGHTVNDKHLNNVSNSEYAKSARVKSLIARDAYESTDLSKLDFSGETIGNFKVALDFCENDCWFKA